MLRPSDLVDLTDSYPNSVDLCSSPPSPGAPSTPATARFPHHHSRAMIQSPSTQDDDTTAAVGLGFGDVQYGAFRDRQGKNLSRHQLDSDSHRRQIQPTTCLVPSGSPPRTASSSTTSNQNPSRSDVSSSSRLHPIKTNIPYFVSSVPTTHPRPTQEPKSDASYVNSSDPLRDLAISLAPPSSPSIHHHPTNQSNDTPRLKRPLDSAPEQDSPMRSPFTPSLIVSHPNSASPSDRVDVSAHVSRQGSQVHRSVPARETTITEDDIDAVEEKLDSMSLEWGLEDEEGDDESEEMQALRSLYGLIRPVMPALRTAPSLREQLDVQKNLVFLLQRRLDLQDTFSQQALIDQRSINDLERSTWASSMALVREKATVEKHLALDRQRQQLGGPPGRNPSGGPTQSRKETGFDKDIDVIDTKDYDKLIKKWLELQADNRRNVAEKAAMHFKLREFELQINALSQELYHLRPSTLRGVRAPQLTRAVSAATVIKTNAPHESVESEPSSSSAPTRRQPLGDAKAEHLLLAAKRLRTLRQRQPDIGLYSNPEAEECASTDAERAADKVRKHSASDSYDGSGSESTHKIKRGGRGKGKKTLAAAAVAAAATVIDPSTRAEGEDEGEDLQSSSSIVPPPRTPMVKARSKKTSATTPRLTSSTVTPGGSNFDDLLLAAQSVLSRPEVSTAPPTSDARDADFSAASEESDTSEPSAHHLGDSPKRRRLLPSVSSLSVWVPGQSPHLSAGTLSAPAMMSTGEMHASALDLLALASFGSPAAVIDPNYLQRQQEEAARDFPTPRASSSRLGGLLGSSGVPQDAPSSSITTASALEPAFVLRPHVTSDSISTDQYFSEPTSLATSPHLAQSPFTPGRSASSHRVPTLEQPAFEEDSSPVQNLPPSSIPHRLTFDAESQPDASSSSSTPTHSSPPKSVVGQSPAASGSEPLKRIRSPYLKWTPEEDELLARGVARHNYDWNLVSKCVPTRSYHQCRQRWLRKLGAFDHKPSPVGAGNSSHTQSPLVTNKSA